MRRTSTFVCQCAAVVFVAVLVLLQGSAVSTQQSLPWTGIATDEARAVDTGAYGAASIRSHALSGDGRYVTFTANYPLLSTDTSNGGVYVRDRMTGAVELVSVASDGTVANGPSDPSAISGNGRHIAFMSSATNLVADDNNGAQDVFVHDRETHTTSLVSLGANGEQPYTALYDGISLSEDGRFVTFGAFFPNPNNWWDMFVRDRDPDMNGVFDEPGTATTTRLASSLDGMDFYFSSDAAVSPDGRYIAFAAYWTGANGQRVFLLDQQTSTTVMVDVPLNEGAFDGYAYSHSLSLSNGHLAYVTNVDNLVEGDTDQAEDVFVYDIAAGTNSIVRASVPDVPALPYKDSVGISADGRYVVFTGGHLVEPYGQAVFGFAVDRETGQIHEIGLAADGTRTESVYSVAISADASAIAMWNRSDVLAIPDANFGVYVETALSMSISTVDVPEEGGTYSVDVNAPANTIWHVEHDPAIGVTPDSGVGAATIEVIIDPNTTGTSRVSTVAIGSAATKFRQLVPMSIEAILPSSGGVSGGIELTIVGNGFTQQSTVTFGGTSPPYTAFMDAQHLIVHTPQHARGLVDVVVSDPLNPAATLVDGFRYLDETPPLFTSHVTGTPGNNDWYVSDVSVVWTVEDPESDVELLDCEDFVLTHDDITYAACSASSEGGYNGDSIEIKRDATPPTIQIQSPQQRAYQLNEIAALDVSCEDNFSGVEFCVPSQGGNLLDTSALGTFTFTVNATDIAGNTATSSVTYTVKAASNIAVEFASGPYGGSTTLNATLTRVGIAMAGKTLTFSIDQQLVGSATTNASGVATLPVSLAGLITGGHAIVVAFAGDAATLASIGNAGLGVFKAQTFVTWQFPFPITYGTPLSGAQLNAHASVPGTFTYTPPAGTILNAGTQTLLVTFTPNDTTNYFGSSGSVLIAVGKATPSITWPATAPITYGTALNVAQLNASANVAGTFGYSPGSGTVLAAGPQTLTALFTPADTANYNSIGLLRQITVNRAPLTVYANNSSKVYGQALPAFTAAATEFVNGDSMSTLNGTLAFSTLATASSAPGTYSVTPGGVSSPNYWITFAAGTLTITKADSSLSLTADPNPSRPNRDVTLQAVVSAVAPGAGTASGTVEFREGNTLIGTAPLVNGVATLTRSFKKGTHPLTATYAGNANFNGAAGATTLSTN